MTKNKTTKNYRIPADQIQNLEIDRNGRVAPRLHDLEPLKNTLLSVLYPEIKVASVNVPTEILDDYEESQVENRLAKLVWNGIHYKLVGASGSAKKGKFYFVDEEHSYAIAERFQHWPQAAIVYFGILVSSCKVMIEQPDSIVLMVADGKLGTNDCRGWIRRSLFLKLQEAHEQQLIVEEIDFLLRERHDKGLDQEILGEQESQELTEVAKQRIRHKILPDGRFYQFRMAFSNTQAKGSFKVMEDDAADALEADFILPESAVKPGLRVPAVTHSMFGRDRRFRGTSLVGIREFSRELDFESSYTLLEHAPEDSIQLEVLPQAMEQVRKLRGAVSEGRYEELLSMLGRHPEDLPESGRHGGDEFRIVEGLLLADASGEIVRHPYVNNQLNKLLARWAYKVTTGGGLRLPAFALMDDGYLYLKDGKVLCGSDWIPHHTAIVAMDSTRGLCVRYPIRMQDDLLPFENLSEEQITDKLSRHIAAQGGTVSAHDISNLIANQLRMKGTYVLNSATAKKNGGDYDFDWICVVEGSRFPRFVNHRFSRGLREQQGKNKKDKARDPWFNLEHVAMTARGNHIGSITDLMTSCRASGKEHLAQQLAQQLQNALDSLKWQVQPDLKLVSEIRQQVRQAPWLRHKNERRISDMPVHLDVEETDRVGNLYNHVRKDIEDILTNRTSIEAFKSLVVGEQVTREMMKECRFINQAYAAMIATIALRRDRLKKQLEEARTEWEKVRQSPDKELRRQKQFAMNQSYGACHFDEERGKYEMKSILAFIRVWSQNKTENRFGWLQALNRVVSRGERSTGSILVLAFPQELIVKLAERTGGKSVRVHVPKLYEGLVHTDSSGRVFLVDPIKGGGQKCTFLFKLKDGKILLDDKPEQTQPPTSEDTQTEQYAATAAAHEDLEFPTVLPDGDFNDASWVM